MSQITAKRETKAPRQIVHWSQSCSGAGVEPSCVDSWVLQPWLWQLQVFWSLVRWSPGCSNSLLADCVSCEQLAECTATTTSLTRSEAIARQVRMVRNCCMDWWTEFGSSWMSLLRSDLTPSSLPSINIRMDVLFNSPALGIRLSAEFWAL